MIWPIPNFFFTKWPLAANGLWRPFWMTENHFRSHFSPFQINTQLLFFNFFYTIAAGGHIGWPKITFNRISRYFISIPNFNFFLIFFSQNGLWWPFLMTENHFQSHFSLAAVLDDRKSLLVAFLCISDQYLTFFSQNGLWRPFWMTENHFWSHFSPLQINMQLLFFWFFYKMPAGGHFGWLKITLNRISRYFRSIHNFNCFS